MINALVVQRLGCLPSKQMTRVRLLADALRRSYYVSGCVFYIQTDTHRCECRHLCVCEWMSACAAECLCRFACVWCMRV